MAHLGPHPKNADGYPVNAKGQKVCDAALRKRIGWHCARFSVSYCQSTDTYRCKFHGSRSRKGISHGRWKTGEHSKYLPVGNLKADYDRLANDPNLLSLHDDIALHASRMLELTRKLGDESPSLGVVVDALVDYERVRAPIGDEKVEGCFQKLRDAIRQRVDAEARQNVVWDDIRKMELEKAKLVAVEHDKLKTEGGYIHIDVVVEFAKWFLTFSGGLLENQVMDVQAKKIALQDGWNKMIGSKLSIKEVVALSGDDDEPVS